MGKGKNPTRDYTIEDLEGVLIFSTYEEMAARPKFKCEIDSKRVKPLKAIGYYPRFVTKVRCGRSGCHAPQYTGYLVECDDDSETNIGIDCGRSWLGIQSFSEMRSDFHRRHAQASALHQVRNAIRDAKTYVNAVKNLIDRPTGARWLVQSLRSFREAFPRSVTSTLSSRALKGEPLVERVRPRTPTELDGYDLSHAPPDSAAEDVKLRYARSEARVYIVERVGAFEGLLAFTEAPRSLLFQVLQPETEQLEQLDANTMNAKERAKLLPWLRDFDSSVATVESWLEAGIQFFSSESNFKLFGELPISDDDRHAASRIRWDFANGCARRG